MNVNKKSFLTTLEEYHDSLIEPDQVKKKRKCLKCGKFFISDGPGHRHCAQCAANNARAPFRASQSL